MADLWSRIAFCRTVFRKVLVWNMLARGYLAWPLLPLSLFTPLGTSFSSYWAKELVRSIRLVFRIFLLITTKSSRSQRTGFQTSNKKKNRWRSKFFFFSFSQLIDQPQNRYFQGGFKWQQSEVIRAENFLSWLTPAI